MRILVLNAGSSSLKASLVDEPGDVTALRETLETTEASAWSAWLEDHLTDAPPAAIGHRVVHGGTRRGPMRLGEDAIEELETLRRLAPLHNGPALELVGATRRTLPAVPQFACFDTDFHATLPRSAVVYPVPYAWFEERGVRRYGFHGLSVAWAVERTAALLERPASDLNIVVAHLGSGCSVTAVRGGSSVWTSMGMTPLEGLMMGTRSGSIDPGITLELLASGSLSVPELAKGLQHESGLLGVSGVSADLRAVREAASRDSQAALALEMFVARAAAGIAAGSTALPTMDAIAFTGGIGANDAEAVIAICQRLAVIGVRPDVDRAADGSDAVISRENADVAVLQVSAREDLVIARQVAAANQASDAAPPTQ